ncbi:MAG: hypothetical protein IJZ91_05840 [Oscillospiraceae bacterium]|nr:hypothetical protein [Oscillospiraceae bacterium]
MNIDMNISLIDLIASGISLLSLIAATYVGITQNRINKKLYKMQDNVDVFLRTEYIFSNERNNLLGAKIQIRNISALPLTLVKYTFNDAEWKISPYRLPPASQFPDAYYYINLPSTNYKDYAVYELHFLDALKRKWLIKGFAEFKNNEWHLSWDMPKREK